MLRRVILAAVIAVAAYAVGAGAAGGLLSRLTGDPRAAAVATAAPDPAVSSGGPASNTSAATGGASARTAAATLAPSTPSATPAPPTPSATPAPPPSAPLTMTQSLSGGAPLATGAWTNGVVVFEIGGPRGRTDLRAGVEVQPLSHALDGSSMTLATLRHGVASVPVAGLVNGRYHWRARLLAYQPVGSEKGPWSSYANGGKAFAIQTTPPAAPAIVAPVAVSAKPAVFGAAPMPFRWAAPSDPSGIVAYSYRLDQNAAGQAATRRRSIDTKVSLRVVQQGTYYFHVRALDGAGNWSTSATTSVRVDLTAPRIVSHAFSGYYFNPALEPLTMTYTLDKISRVTVGIYNAAGTRVRHLVYPDYLPPGVVHKVVWNGRDDGGALVPEGSYSIYMRPTDRLGNTPAGAPGWAGLSVTYKRIVVSLARQELWAYDGPRLFAAGLVTTGNTNLPTPVGTFHVLFAKHPFTFHSPWPKTSPYWYPDSLTNFALYFKDSGYFIHDAPWRTAYGPGTNTGPGIPGEGPTSGTHGCVNVPYATMAQLYGWAVPGTAVQIIQ